ncbi:unnamed protein product [Gongylonema pulchrum]|uniref:Uncharacterized protein n=1 Tax=Gongylonema pulchrum TaxID=637853 RepID=A0A3P6SJG5_9BILA|nr:unnamed protein product [Gongylonema pulchrum]
MAREYKLEISLFERLIKNHFPYTALESQHRMATLISGTLMPIFYPQMLDASNVLGYPNIKGKNFVFMEQL